MVKSSYYSEEGYYLNLPDEPNVYIEGEKKIKTPVFLFLDTSVLPRFPRTLNIHFSRLRKLSKLGLIKIFLSEVTFKEWESRLQEAWYIEIKQINAGIELIKKHNWLPKNFVSSEETAILDSIKEKFNDSNMDFKSLFQEQLSSLNYETLNIRGNQASNVFKDYFAGSGPFKEKKNRNDLPDAFIYQCALDLTPTLETPLHCIVNDEKLRTSLDMIEDIVTYQSINSFFDSEIGEEIRKLYKEKEFTDEFITRVNDLYDRYDDSEFIEFLIDDLTKGEFSWDGQINIGIPAKIETVYECNSFNAWWDDAYEVMPGQGIISLPFQAIFTVKISYDISQYEYLKNSGLTIEDIFSAEYQAKILKYEKVQIEVESNLSFHYDIRNIDNIEYDNFYLDEYYHVSLVEDEN